LLASHHVASALSKSRAPGMSSALKRAKNSAAVCLLSCVVMSASCRWLAASGRPPNRHNPGPYAVPDSATGMAAGAAFECAGDGVKAVRPWASVICGGCAGARDPPAHLSGPPRSLRYASPFSATRSSAPAIGSDVRSTCQGRAPNAASPAATASEVGGCGGCHASRRTASGGSRFSAGR
jgi:hypothetical protein